MSVRNVSVLDLALVELLRGETAAPKPVLKQLALRGYVKLESGRPKLTKKGRARAMGLAPFEHDLRAMFGGDPLTAPRTPTIQAVAMPTITFRRRAM
jgi:hypothetical protein